MLSNRSRYERAIGLQGLRAHRSERGGLPGRGGPERKLRLSAADRVDDDAALP